MHHKDCAPNGSAKIRSLASQDSKGKPLSGKTVYVLGAGFSHPAGIPSQAELLSVALEYPDLSDSLNKCKAELLKYVSTVYGLTESQAKNVPLEDLYTPLHHAVVRNEYLKSYSPQKLKRVENCLNRLISHVIDNGKIDSNHDQTYVDDFLEPLIDTKRKHIGSDRFSIISLNWDILVDKRLSALMDAKGVMDYCCHFSGIDPANSEIPAILAPKIGKFGVKLLKLHGSLNWLICPQCARIMVNRDEKIGIKGFEGKAECRFCGQVKLNPALLLPSFRKNLDSFHFQHIWHQAAIELSTAKRLVFIGYSFPLADFDFRTLITKRVGDLTVEVVLWSENGEETPEGKRYKAYFGKKIAKIHYCGVKDYIRDFYRV